MNIRSVVVLAVIGAAGCGSKPAGTAPTVTVTAGPAITAPSVQSPGGGQTVSSLQPTLTAGSATVDQSAFTLQYRFQVLNASDVVVEDSGLVNALGWTPTKALTPLSTYTWRARAESQGYLGPWSAAATFRTPDAPVAYSRPIGDWQSCAAFTGSKGALVNCVWNAVRPNDTVSGMEYVKRVAWLLRGEGAGLLIKSSGENTIVWQGYSLSASRVCYPDGHIYKLLSDAGPGGANLPQFADNDFVDKALYVAAIDPSKP